jgi:hypothetical protein
LSPLLLRLLPLAAFLGGFIWDTLTLGRRVSDGDFYVLAAYLMGAALLIQYLARRYFRGVAPPAPGSGWPARLAWLRWHAPYLLVQFFFGGVFSALFILYFKSAGYLGTWLTAAVLGALLVANEFAGDRYGRKFTLTWALFAFNACLLLNFVFPYLLGSLNPVWFYVSSACAALLTYGLWRLAPPGCGRIRPAFTVIAVLVLAWFIGLIAPVPLVKKAMAVGHDFTQDAGRYQLQVEAPAFWQIWKTQSASVHLAAGARLYGVSSVHAPLGVTAELQHRWEFLAEDGWRQTYRRDFQSTGGREHGFRAYSWILDPAPGEWRFIVATQDGRTIGVEQVTVVRDDAAAIARVVRDF